MYNRSKILALAVLICLVFIPISEFVASIHSTTNDAVETNPKFVIAGWDYPDEYGQGIFSIRPYENSSGSWVNFGGWVEYYESTELEFNASAAIKLKVLSTLNATLTGAISLSDGKNYFQHSVVVTNSSAEIFSQQNFTYIDSADEETGIYDYEYDVILNFISISGTIYTVNVDYEVFYLGGSGEYEADEQSINSFAETLPDDVLYYPDLFTWSIMTATDGTGEYLRLNDTDEITIDGDIILYFDIDASGTDVFEGIDYYLNVLTAIGWMAVYNYTSDSWETVTEIDDVWKNGTIYSKDYFEYNVGTYRMSINLTDVLSADYLGVSFKGMTLSSSDGYAESFADVSDWSYMTSTGLGAGEYSITSDGDQATIEILADSSANEYVIYSSTAMAGMSTENYAEIRYSTMTGAAFYCYIQTTTGNGFLAAQTGVVTGETMKSLISAISGISAGGTITLIRIYCDDMPDSTATTIHTHVEYLRVGPCNEMGWQHDGSTTIGITSSDGGTISTDGDNLTLTSDTDASSFEFAFDTTTTQASLRTAYYPFLVVNCTSVSEGDGWKLEQYDGSAWATLQSSYITTGGIYRYNMASLDTYVQKLRFNFTQTAIITFPFIKAYSIANYTYNGTGVSVDDVLYVSDGTLYCQATSITSMILDRDPALSVSTSPGDMWSITTSSGTPQTDYYVGAWAGYSSETEGDLAAGTLTDVRIKFTDSANIAAIIFLEHIAGWVTVTESVLYFQVPFDYWALNMGLIFGGLILMLLSTCIIAKKVRDKNISTDAGMILLLLFCVGWGLFIGGALIG